MSANRIRRYFETPQVNQRPSNANVPSGFVELPQQFRTPGTQGEPIQNQIYRMAYEQAQAQARARLLDLLQSRAGLIGYDFEI